MPSNINLPINPNSQLPTKAGVPVDTDWTDNNEAAPPNGTVIIDTDGPDLYARVGDAWVKLTNATA